MFFENERKSGAEITKIITDIRRRSVGKTLFNNCYENFLKFRADYEFDTLISDNTIIILQHEESVERAYICSNDMYEAAEMSRKALKTGCVTEYLFSNQNEYDSIFQIAGFQKYKMLCRHSNTDVEKYITIVSDEGHDVSVDAEEKDAVDIHKLLFEVFDPKESHLQSVDGILNSIQNCEYRIIRGDKGIVTLLQTQVKPKKYYFNQVINKGDKRLFHYMIHHSIRQYYEQGGKYAYAWVNIKNIASQRFFSKYGLAPDDMHIQIYLKD